MNRLKAIGGGLSLTSWRYLAGTPDQNGPPFKMIVNNGIKKTSSVMSVVGGAVLC